ncbi:MAG: glycosyltransferase family 39 protein [Acidobacteria bacterium]|nr:glycosyltransferase family 39 protein [Acidobacteriota bacterium]
MTRPDRGGDDHWRRHRASLALVAVFALGIFLYTARLRHNPPGFFVDESSVAYNAYTISQTGRDEFGVKWPLFFRAFGDYKNPIYVYLLAALFKLFGPGIFTARLLSAVAGIMTATLLGLLAARISKRREVGLLVAATALLTPWLFEMSRVVLEVALYPLAVVLFLLCLQRASTKDKWSWLDALSLAATLALLTYTYSIGRLLAPLLALGLVIFTTRTRWPGILRAWALYGLALLPMFVFQRRHPGALTGRFDLITYITPQSSAARVAWEFVKHFAGNLDPRRLLLTGDTSIWQVAHVRGTPALLAATLILVATGAWLVLRRHRRDAWWRFVFYGLAASVVPASLTADYFHMLRLASVPVFLLVLAVPAFARLIEEGGRRRSISRTR